MNLSCEIFASFLLIFHVSAKGAVPKEVWGALGREFYLNIPDSLVNQPTGDIQWKIGNTRIARFTKSKITSTYPYEVFPNGTLKIKNLMRNYSNTYIVNVYHENGKHVLEKAFTLKTLEGVSEPVVSWNCHNKSLICEVMNGTDPELKLSQNNRDIKKVHQKLITYNWMLNQNPSFKCTASNKASEETSEATIMCTEKGLDTYFIIGICGGGILFILFVALLIFFISRRGKQNRRRNDEELEIRAHRVTAEERGRRPQQSSTPQKPAASQPPPPPGHRSQAPGQRLLPPGPHGQFQQQKKPPPSLGPQVPQQKGPPLPRPRVQQRPPTELKKTHNSVA
ncbi:T-cell surface antigen CD2 [Tamandua tetradactyla]|uniref:T-cell surface antigen CD2 n=1 Tax=Tamandua tetradactyla TaxID=48850 RepID=UPI0040539DF2